MLVILGKKSIDINWFSDYDTTINISVRYIYRIISIHEWID